MFTRSQSRDLGRLWDAATSGVRRMTKFGILSRTFFGLFKDQPSANPWQAEADKVRSLATPCPICGNRDLSGHWYTLFASQIAAEVTDELKQFFALFRERRWQELHQICEFEGRWNAALTYAVFCHRGGYMMAVRDPVELYDASNVLEVIQLDEDEVEKIRSLPIELHEL
jgi:hypothetical protein